MFVTHQHFVRIGNRQVYVSELVIDHLVIRMQKLIVKKLIGLDIFWGKKNFGSEIILGQNNLVEIFFGLNIFLD